MSLHIKIFQLAILCALFVGCSEHSPQKEVAQQERSKELGELQLAKSKQSAYLRVLDEIPKHIRQVENLTIFPGESRAQYIAKLIPVQTYGKTGELQLTSVEGLTVDIKDNVIVTNRGTNYALTLQVFNKNGNYLAPLGRTGRGPGEYLRPTFTQAGAGKVYVYDLFGKRLNSYDTDDYSFIRSTLTERWDILNYEGLKGWELGGLEVRSDGNILVNFYNTIKIKKSSSRWEESIS